MLIGEFQHNIDQKGRVFIPARFRDDLGECFFVTKGPEACLFAYSRAEWEKLDAKVRALPMSKARKLQIYLFAGAACVEADRQGRILLPANLREHAGLVKDVMIIGASSRVEIWDKQKWTEFCSSITSETIAGAMDELGF